MRFHYYGIYKLYCRCVGKVQSCCDRTKHVWGYHSGTKMGYIISKIDGRAWKQESPAKWSGHVIYDETTHVIIWFWVWTRPCEICESTRMSLWSIDPGLGPHAQEHLALFGVTSSPWKTVAIFWKTRGHSCSSSFAHVRWPLFLSSCF